MVVVVLVWVVDGVIGGVQVVLGVVLVWIEEGGGVDCIVEYYEVVVEDVVEQVECVVGVCCVGLWDDFVYCVVGVGGIGQEF